MKEDQFDKHQVEGFKFDAVGVYPWSLNVFPARLRQYTDVVRDVGGRLRAQLSKGCFWCYLNLEWGSDGLIAEFETDIGEHIIVAQPTVKELVIVAEGLLFPTVC